LPPGYVEGITDFEAGTFEDRKIFYAGLRTMTTIEGLESGGVPPGCSDRTAFSQWDE